MSPFILRCVFFFFFFIFCESLRLTFNVVSLRLTFNVVSLRLTFYVVSLRLTFTAPDNLALNAFDSCFPCVAIR